MRPYTEVPFNARASSSSSSTLFRHWKPARVQGTLLGSWRASIFVVTETESGFFDDEIGKLTEFSTDKFIKLCFEIDNWGWIDAKRRFGGKLMRIAKNYFSKARKQKEVLNSSKSKTVCFQRIHAQTYTFESSAKWFRRNRIDWRREGGKEDGGGLAEEESGARIPYGLAEQWVDRVERPAVHPDCRRPIKISYVGVSLSWTPSLYPHSSPNYFYCWITVVERALLVSQPQHSSRIDGHLPKSTFYRALINPFDPLD